MWPTVVDNTLASPTHPLRGPVNKAALRAEKRKDEEEGEGGRENGWRDARFPHLKHPFLEMFYAIYKKVKEKEKLYTTILLLQRLLFETWDTINESDDCDGATKKKRFAIETDLCCRPHNPQHG